MSDDELDTREPEQSMEGYAALEREFRNVPDAIASFVQPISEGIEAEAFAGSRFGKLLIGMAVHGAREALEVLLDPNSNDERCKAAIGELRVRHRVLDYIKSTIASGRAAEKQLKLRENVSL